LILDEVTDKNKIAVFFMAHGVERFQLQVAPINILATVK